MAKKLGGLGKGLNAIFIENDSEKGDGAVTLKISEIEPNRSQPRQSFDEAALSELAESISAHGLLQPLLVRPLPLGGYEIVAGERRYRACRMAGLTEVPVVIRELTESETMELALIENLQREDLTPLEEAEGYNVLMKEHNFTQEEVAQSMGKSRPAIANALRLLKLPESIREMLREEQISAGHARALLTLENEEQMKAVAEEIIKKASDRGALQKARKGQDRREARKTAVVLQDGGAGAQRKPRQKDHRQQEQEKRGRSLTD